MIEKKYLIPLIDGGVIKIDYDSNNSDGCETCDYGSSYMNDFKISMTSGEIKIKIDQMYEYALSEGYMMMLFLINLDEIKTLTEELFFVWLEKKVKSDVKDKDIGNEPTFIFIFNKELD